MIGKTDLEVHPPELAESYRTDDAEVMAAGGSKRFEEHHVTSNGEDTLIETINHGCPNLKVIGPVSKVLACGDEGMGGMASVETLVNALREVQARSPRTGTPSA